MKITEDVRKYAAENALAEAEALEQGMREKSREFVASGAEIYHGGAISESPQGKAISESPRFFSSRVEHLKNVLQKPTRP